MLVSPHPCPPFKDKERIPQFNSYAPVTQLTWWRYPSPTPLQIFKGLSVTPHLRREGGSYGIFGSRYGASPLEVYLFLEIGSREIWTTFPRGQIWFVYFFFVSEERPQKLSGGKSQTVWTLPTSGWAIQRFPRACSLVEKRRRKCMIDRNAQSRMCMLIGGQEDEKTLATSIP